MQIYKRIIDNCINFTLIRNHHKISNIFSFSIKVHADNAINMKLQELLINNYIQNDKIEYRKYISRLSTAVYLRGNSSSDKAIINKGMLYDVTRNKLLIAIMVPVTHNDDNDIKVITPGNLRNHQIWINKDIMLNENLHYRSIKQNIFKIIRKTKDFVFAQRVVLIKDNDKMNEIIKPLDINIATMYGFNADINWINSLALLNASDSSAAHIKLDDEWNRLRL